MDNKVNIKVFSELLGQGNVLPDERMENHTSFKVGGPADLILLPDSVEKLQKIMEICSRQGLPVFVMGNGTNLIVGDKGIRGIVIKLLNNFCDCTVKDDMVEAKAGILLSEVANAALKNGLTGLEFASGIPGTLGGAVAMNAGAYGGEMRDVVVSTEYLDQSGNIKVIRGDEHQFGYRTSFIQKIGGIVLKSTLKLKEGDKASIKDLMDDLNGRRRDKQPLEMPSAGSVFKRPEGYFAGKLIEDCGLRGYELGGAQVSPKHCGFIVNKGGATARDILSLIRHIQDTVKAQFGVELQTEVRIVGEE